MANSGIERRYIIADNLKLETRESGGKKKKVMPGYAAMFNKLSEDLGGWREIIEPGAFRIALSDPNLDVVSLFNHNPDHVLARTTNKSLILREDEIGLHQETEIFDDTTIARDVAAHVEAGRIYQMSFAFTVLDVSWDVANGENLRRVKAVKRLYDVAPVTYPAYPQTTIGMRSLPGVEEFDLSRMLTVLVRAENKLKMTPDDVKDLKDLSKRFVEILKVVDSPEETKGISLEEMKSRIDAVA